MKRVLSLVLVLVLLLGVMPVALADENHNHDITEGGWDWVNDPTAEGYVDATCEHEGVMPQKCSKTDCTARRTVPIDKLPHTIPDEGATIVAATCEKDGSKTGICSVCHATNVTVVLPKGDGSCNWGEPEITATCTQAGKKIWTCADCGDKREEAVDALGHDYVNGKCTRCGETMTNVYSVTASPSSMTLVPGDTAEITLSAVKKADNSTAEVTNKQYLSNDATIATVSSDGKVTAVKKGTTSITYSCTVGEEAFSGTVTVKVDEGAISASGTTVAIGEADSITPKLNVTDVGEVDWTFSNSDDNVVEITDKGDYVNLKGKKAGVSDITIKAAYEVNGVKTEVSTVVRVSVYDTYTASVTLKDGVSGTIHFESTNILSAATYDGKSIDVTNAKFDTIAEILYDGLAQSIAVAEDPYTAGNIGELSGGGSTGITGSTVAINSMEQIKLKLNGKSGSQKFDYYLYIGGLIVGKGVLTVHTSGSDNTITYSVGQGKAVTFNEADFSKLFKSVYSSKTLDYVTFDVSNTSPYYGELYTTKTSKKAVAASMKFAYQFASSTDEYDLDEVTYQSAERSAAYKEEIDFTCYGTDKSYTVSGTVVIKVGETMNFTDVKTTDYFYDAVVWAVNEGVTSGTSATTFSPNKTCSRAEVVTFLWRAAGKPTPTSSYMPFTDVKATDYYYDAVRWAVEEKITTGTSATTFAPNATVTRGQVVTFLFRALKASSVSTSNPFTDVKSSEYYYDAVLWAVKNDVTNGLTATTFGPNSGCTRGQIVTFLYRAYEG